MDILNKTALELGKLIKNKKISALEITNIYLKNIKKNDKNLNAYISVFEEEALNTAKKVQEKIEKENLNSFLAGVPVAVKDNICIKDKLTTCASKMLSNFKAPYNAEVINRLNDSGAIILGKLNMDEFAMGNSNETSYFGSVKNPHNLNYVSGGSSGGSAAAVSGNECVYSICSDTGGSIRLPSSFCGVTGFKPTYGSVSRYGLIAYASSLEQIGVIGKDIKDCAYIFSVISGKDEKDSTSLKTDYIDLNKIFNGEIKKIKIGIPKNCIYNDYIDDQVKECILKSALLFEKCGAEIYEFDMKSLDFMISSYYIIACAEASSNLSKYDGVRFGYRSEDNNIDNMIIKTRSEGFGKEVKKRIMTGSFLLSSGFYDKYYLKALKARNIINNDFKEIFKQYDIILTPTVPVTAFKIGEKIENKIKRYNYDIYTVLANLTGIPAVSIPCGEDKNKLPIGMQLMSKSFNENILLNAANVFQENTSFHLNYN